MVSASTIAHLAEGGCIERPENVPVVDIGAGKTMLANRAAGGSAIVSTKLTFTVYSTVFSDPRPVQRADRQRLVQVQEFVGAASNRPARAVMATIAHTSCKPEPATSLGNAAL